MQFTVGLGPRVLLCDLGAELQMRVQRLAKRLIVGQPGLVGGL
jgi:hypothetical protein